MSDDLWQQWAEDWTTHLEAGDKSPSTIKVYLQALQNLAEWARAQGIGDPCDLTSKHLTAYMAAFRKRKSKSTGKPLSRAYIAKDETSLRVFFKWLAAEELTENAMLGVPKVAAPKVAKPILEDDDLRALLKVCEGRGFSQRRDTAMLRLLIDTGARRSELMMLSVDDVDVQHRLVRYVGKGDRDGSKTRYSMFTPTTAEALTRYLRSRRQHRDRDTTARFWLADKPHRGALGVDGLRLMLNRRSREAGVPNVHPHRFRHTAYNAWREAGGSDGDAMTLFGWSSRAMLDHYAASNAERRALKAAAALRPGERI